MSGFLVTMKSRISYIVNVFLLFHHQSVEGLSYRDLIKTLDNVINRCYGRK